MGFLVAWADPTGAALAVAVEAVVLTEPGAELGAELDTGLAAATATVAVDAVDRAEGVTLPLAVAVVAFGVGLAEDDAVAVVAGMATASGRVQPPGVPAIPPSRPATTSTRAMTTMELLDQAVTRTRRRR
ncbi:MAG TPA: hypothetical protein DEG88_14320 [Propionibacteriaceae bacterium]|nr:hypothetical protein [Micropruina sp.]HBX80014.1 hypothetical protein [Propionibacteriaceae bacterium]HBY24389.1 hypothetical protein [Propionibacteriaceae bacterium]